MNDGPKSDGNGRVFINGVWMEFTTYVVMTLDSINKRSETQEARTSRLERAALGLMTFCCLAILSAILYQLGLKP